MELNLFGYKFNVELLILICILYVIICLHTVCSCWSFNFGNSYMEGLETMTTDISGNKLGGIGSGTSVQLPTQIGVGSVSGNMVHPAGSLVSGKPKEGSANANGSTKEGFSGANTNYGESSAYNLNSSGGVNTSSWYQPDLSVVAGKPLSPAVQEIINRKGQPVPLPEGEMLFLNNTEFSPSCCPSTYSNSSGCSCLSVGQYNYLVTRGGNNMPYSEY